MKVDSLSYRAGRRMISELLRIIHPYEKFVLSRLDYSGKISPPPLFIIGAPRTGSTIIEQVITNYFEVNYISNFSALFYHSLYTGMLLYERLIGPKPHNNFESNYGRTMGSSGSNECGKFWYRWFPRNRHYVGADEFSYEELFEIRQTIFATTKALPRPFVFKNLNCGQRLQVLRKILPEALFIYCRRNPLYTAQSLLLAREYKLGTNDAWLSVMPRNVEELKTLPYHEQVVFQVYYLQKQIEQDLLLFSPVQFLTITYEDFCRDLPGHIEKIRFFFEQNGVGIKKRENGLLPILTASERLRLSTNDIEKIKQVVNRLDW